MSHIKCIDNLDVGYIGYSNSKTTINDEGMLKNAYGSGNVHKDGLPVFFMAMADKKRSLAKTLIEGRKLLDMLMMVIMVIAKHDL